MAEGFQLFGLPAYSTDMFEVFEEENAVLWKLIEDGELTMEGLRQVRWNRIFHRLGINYDGPAFEMFFKDGLFNSAIPVAGARELLTELSRKTSLFAASNGPAAQQKNRLAKAGFTSFFRGIYVSEELGVSKPDVEFFRNCLRLAGKEMGLELQPEQCVMIGDSLRSDMRGAASAGIRTCLYRYGGGDSYFELPNGVDAAVCFLGGIPGTLNRLFS